MDLERKVLPVLDGVRQVGSSKWVAKCPSHQDKTPSLSLTYGRNGRVLIHCFGGCSTTDVLGALGLSWADLFAEDSKPPVKKSNPLSDYIIAIARADLASGKRLNQADKETLKQALLDKVG